MADNLRRYPEFAEQVRAKLARGQVIFEDRNFLKNAVDLVAEVQAELVDTMGWTFLVWSRIEAMREALELLGFESQEGLPNVSRGSPEDLPQPAPFHRLDAEDEPLRNTGADRGRLLPDPKDGLAP